MGNLHISLRSTGDWSGREKAQTLADILSAGDDFWVPEKLDNREPPRFVFDPEDLDA